MWIVNAALNHRYTIMISLCCIVGGVALSLIIANNFSRQLPPVVSVAEKDEASEGSPQADSSVPKESHCVVVLTLYPDMPAEDVEKDITNHMERRTGQAAGTVRQESRSITGASIVRNYYHSGTDPNDALTQVNSLASAAIPNLPPGALPPLVIPFNQAYVLPVGILALNNPEMSPADLVDIARFHVRNELLKVPGALVPIVLGGRARDLRVVLEPNRMQAHGLSPADVAAALSVRQDMVRFGTQEFQLDSDRRPRAVREPSEVADHARAVRELSELPVRTRSGKTIYLRDVALVEHGSALTTALARLNSRRQICVPIYRTGEAKAATVADAIEAAIPEIQKKLPNRQGKPAAEAKLEFWPFRIGSGKAMGPADTGLITIYLRAQSSMRIEASEEVVSRVEHFLMENIPPAERAFIFSEVGLSPDWSAVYTQNSGPQDMTIRVQLATTRTSTAQDHVRELRPLFQEQFPGLQASFHAGVAAVSPIVIQIGGGDTEQGRRLSNEVRDVVRDRVAKVAGTADVYLGERLDRPSYVLDVDRKKAAAVGLTTQDVLRQVALQQVAIPIDSARADNACFWFDKSTGTVYPVVLQHAGISEMELEDPRMLPIWTDFKGKLVAIPLGNLATFRATISPVEINHVSLSRVLTVRVNIEGRDLRSVLGDIDKSLKELKVPEGMRIVIKSEESLCP